MLEVRVGLACLRQLSLLTFHCSLGPRGRDPGTVTQFMLQGHKNSGSFKFSVSFGEFILILFLRSDFCGAFTCGRDVCYWIWRLESTDMAIFKEGGDLLVRTCCLVTGVLSITANRRREFGSEQLARRQWLRESSCGIFLIAKSTLRERYRFLPFHSLALEKAEPVAVLARPGPRAVLLLLLPDDAKPQI